MKLATLIASLGVSLAVPAIAQQTLEEVERFASPLCKDQVGNLINCILKFTPEPLAEFYRGLTPEELLGWNELSEEVDRTTMLPADAMVVAKCHLRLGCTCF